MDYGRCRILTDWPDWDCDIHKDKAQIDRQGKAMTYPFSFEIDTENKTARFSSTSLMPYYETSLTSCTCGDFESRHLPCKHMYRLAVELGIIEIIKRPPKRKTQTSTKEILAEIYASDDWDSHPEQQKRIKSAKSSKTTPTSIDRNKQTGIFPGSGQQPYETTLHTCTCRDYILRHLPCKHIYRLRIELGLLNEKAETGINKNDLDALQISLKEAVKIIETYSDDLQLIIKDILMSITVQNETKAMIELDNITEQLKNCPLFTVSITPSETILSLYRKKDILEFLDENNIEYPDKLRKNDLIMWCIKNISNISECHPMYIDVTYVEAFQKASRKTYTYLRRKYDWQSCSLFNENGVEFGTVPAGSKFKSNEQSNIFFFPDDEVTQLLTEHNCNRCLNGFVVSSPDDTSVMQPENIINDYYNPQDYLHTKWGIYEMPDPYKIKVDYGPREDTKKVQ